MTSDNRKSLLQRMDGLVGWTGFPRRIGLEPRMRRTKWAPFFALAWATAGLVEPFLFPRQATFGLSIIAMATAFAAGFSQIGPMRPKKADEVADEREQLWRARSYMFAFAAISLVALLGLAALAFYAMWSGLFGWTVKSPHAPMVIFSIWLFSLAEYLLVLFGVLPTLHASWTMPEPVEDEPEPEEVGLRFVKPRRR
jgi:hypothetical protein